MLFIQHFMAWIYVIWVTWLGALHDFMNFSNQQHFCIFLARKTMIYHFLLYMYNILHVEHQLYTQSVKSKYFSSIAWAKDYLCFGIQRLKVTNQSTQILAKNIYVIRSGFLWVLFSKTIFISKGGMSRLIAILCKSMHKYIIGGVLYVE